ncbi:MAG TPA: MmcQ/YjbR family DNA-binding protein [Flavobacteriales bacterium]|nr:MmcQ/YjbR family DNA-binding protein [Flavobacteriales bacterium]
MLLFTNDIKSYIRFMNIEDLRKLCLSLPHVTEDIKWGHDLCFCIGQKMFCVTGIDGPLKVSFKVKDDEFHDMSSRPHIVPAPYVARYKWVLVEEPHALNSKEWVHFVNQSYELVKAGLTKKMAESLIKSVLKKASSNKKKQAKKVEPKKKKTVAKKKKLT